MSSDFIVHDVYHIHAIIVRYLVAWLHGYKEQKTKASKQ